jgi:hypothetical protein
MSSISASRPSPWFLAAAVLGLATTAIHVFAGAPEIMAPLLAADLPPVVKGVSDVLWHHITGLLLIARHINWRLPVLVFVGGQFLLIAGLFIAFGLYWFSSPWPMPQWVLFGLMLGLMALGTRRR